MGWFVDSISLTTLREWNHIIVTIHHMFTPIDWLAWVNVGGGCYRVVSEHGSTLGLDGWNLFVIHSEVIMCILCHHNIIGCYYYNYWFR